MRFVKLADGLEMPPLGFGIYRLTDQRICQKAVEDALACGFRLLDTAEAYLNEEAVARALAASGLGRDELFITGKLWLAHAGRSQAEKAFMKSLENLGLDYFDLYLIHQPWGDWHGAWDALCGLKKKGLARALGVSNFSLDRIAELSCLHEQKPVLNQIEINPFCQRRKEVAWLGQKRIMPQAWAPLAQGAAVNNPVLRGMAQKRGISTAQLVLAWLAARNIPAVVQTVHEERMKEDLAALEIELSAGEMDEIATLDTGKSYFYEHDDPEIVEKFCSAARPTREELLKAVRAARQARKK